MHMHRHKRSRESASGKVRAYLADQIEIVAFAAICLVSMVLGATAWMRFLS